DHDEMLGFAERLQQAAAASGQFAFPPILDVKIDQARTEIVIDRDKAASMGLSMQQLGMDLSVLLGGNYVNRFSISGRSYKVIPQVERASRLTPDQLEELFVTGPRGELMPLSTVATLVNSVEPRSLNRFQQLNSIKISGMTTRSLDAGLKLLEDEAKRILPAGYRLDYTGQSRQLREEGGKFLPALG